MLRREGFRRRKGSHRHSGSQDALSVQVPRIKRGKGIGLPTEFLSLRGPGVGRIEQWRALKPLFTAQGSPKASFSDNSAQEGFAGSLEVLSSAQLCCQRLSCCSGQEPGLLSSKSWDLEVLHRHFHQQMGKAPSNVIMSQKLQWCPGEKNCTVPPKAQCSHQGPFLASYHRISIPNPKCDIWNALKPGTFKHWYNGSWKFHRTDTVSWAKLIWKLHNIPFKLYVWGIYKANELCI